MKKTLQKKTEEWMKLERRTLEQRKKAEEYYEHELMSDITAEYLRNNKHMLTEEVKYLIMSVGTSYEPIVLNISLLQPERILFLYTEKSEQILDKVVDFCGLKLSRIEKSRVNETSPTDIYREIKRCYLEWGKPGKIYIDFTGGTKAMSTAAAMAGAAIHVQMIYVGTNQYLTDFRKPFPGSERLFRIPNPMDIFGELETDKAIELFSQYNYAGTREKLGELKETVPDPAMRQELNFVYLLAQVYENWDALDFVNAEASMARLLLELARDMKNNWKFVLTDLYDALLKQENHLKFLRDIPELARQKRHTEILQKKEYIIPLMFTMYQNAMVREFQEKYDMATLLLYRLLEMIEQRRLSQYSLFVSRMEYMKMTVNGKEITAEEFQILKDKVAELKKGLFGKCGSSYLPEQISLLEGFILLAALEDPMVYDGRAGLPVLKRIRAMVFLRNNSIFAHGLAPVEIADYRKFSLFVIELFQKFCSLEKIDFEENRKCFRWLSPLDSCYYQKNRQKNEG